MMHITYNVLWTIQEKLENFTEGEEGSHSPPYYGEH